MKKINPTVSYIVKTIFFVVLQGLLFLIPPASEAGNVDLTDHIRVLGIPLKERYPSRKRIYARNIWEVTEYNGKVYLGGGNSSNQGPAANAGPVPVICYDPATARFSPVYTVNEEQIDRIIVHGDTLYIPGHDLRGPGNFGTVYSYTDKDYWSLLSTIPGTAHVYDLAFWDGKIFAALGTRKQDSIAVSADDGITWRKLSTQSPRIYSFVNVGGKLFATGTFYLPEVRKYLKKEFDFKEKSIFEYRPDSTFAAREDLQFPEILFPGAIRPGIPRYKIYRSLQFKGKTVYIGASVHNDHQAVPVGLFFASSFDKENVDTAQINMPENAVPRDIAINNSRIFVLADYWAEGQKQVAIFSSSDLKTWNEVFFFTTAASLFGRAFCFLENTVYIGMGSEIENPRKWSLDELSFETGSVIAVDLSVLPQ